MAHAIDRETVEALFKRGLSEGGIRPSFIRLEWQIAGNCISPVTRWVDARPAADGKGRELVVIPGKTAVPLQIDLDVRCRTCRNCLRYRRYVWTARAIAEYRLAVRTWLGTFTLSLDEHEMVRHLVIKDISKIGLVFEEMTEGEQFIWRHRKISRWFTLWLKRIRKNSGAKIRYLLVCEAHKSGLPHYHALIHESHFATPVTKSIMEAAWPHGFTHFKLVPPDESAPASYACKYLGKSNLARVRASLQYGNPLRKVPT